MSKTRKLLRLGEVLVQALIFLVLTICLHEYAHAQVVNLLGEEAYVKYTLLSGVTIVSRIPAYQHWYILTAFAGGGTVALVYYVLDGLILEDDTSIALRLVIGHQLPYAIFEGLGLNTTPLCRTAIGVGIILAAGWSIPLFKKMI